MNGAQTENQGPEPASLKQEVAGQPHDEPNSQPISRSPAPSSEAAEDDDSAAASGDANTGRWTKAEHQLFMEALKLYGKDWKKVQQHVGTRTTTQARSHAQKYFGKLDRQTKNKDEGSSASKSAPAPLPAHPVPVPAAAPAGAEPAGEELPSTSRSNSPSSVSKSLPLETSPTKRQGRKRLRGPFKPGKRPIKCDSTLPIPQKLPKTEPSEAERPLPPPLQPLVGEELPGFGPLGMERLMRCHSVAADFVTGLDELEPIALRSYVPDTLSVHERSQIEGDFDLGPFPPVTAATTRLGEPEREEEPGEKKEDWEVGRGVSISSGIAAVFGGN